MSSDEDWANDGKGLWGCFRFALPAAALTFLLARVWRGRRRA